MAPIHPSPVATPTVLNAAHYKLFQPDLEDPAYDDFAVAARSLNAFPIAALESVDISNAVLLPRLRDGRYATGITHIVGAGGGR